MLSIPQNGATRVPLSVETPGRGSVGIGWRIAVWGIASILDFASLSPSNLLILPFDASIALSLPHSLTMAFRALRPARALPLRSRVAPRYARRAVTTDAASAHTEREHVPEVWDPLCHAGELF